MLGIGIAFAGSAHAAANVYYSVGQDNTTDRKTGSPTMTIASGTATFSEAQTGNIGVGDRVTYNTSSIAYISSKISQTQWTLVTATGGTPADVTNQTVNSIRREYASLSSAEAGAPDVNHINNTSLVAADVVLNLPCYYDTGADTVAVTINGWTTDATRYIKIYTPNNTVTEANQSQRHQGKWDEGKYRLEITNSTAILVQERYTRIDGLQIRTLDPTSNGRNCLYQIGGGEGMISNNIIRGHNHPTYTQDGINLYATDYTEKVWNNILYDFYAISGNNILSIGDVSAAYIFNNTFIGGNRVRANYANVAVAINNISIDSIAGFSGTWANGSDYNLSDVSGDDVPGTHSFAGLEPGFTNKILFDFHLSPTDTIAKDAGTNLSSDPNLPFSNDIDGQARSSASNWDIGADEYAMHGAFTLSAWVRPTGASAASKAIIGKAEELRLVTDGSGNPLCQIKSGATWQTAATSSAALTLNEWAHVACSYDKSSLKVYVNGVRKASQSLSVGVDDTTYHLKFGADDSAGSSYADYQGYMDEVRLYPYARSATQIGFDYNVGFAGMSSQKGAAVTLGNLSDKWMTEDLVGYWRMDEASWNGTSGEVRDSSGNTKHGTGFGGVTTAVGRFGKGGSFDGTDDYVNPGDLGNNIRTVTFWIKTDTLTSQKVIDFDGTDQIELDGSGNITATSFPGTTTVYVDAAVSPALTDGWHHVTITDTEGVTGSAVNLGRVSSGYFDGALDEVRFYTRVLSPGEVDKLYQWEPKPILHIKMDEKVSGDARTLYDTSGNQRNATTEQGANESGMDCTQRGKYGSGCDLDGSDDSIEMSDFDY